MPQIRELPSLSTPSGNHLVHVQASSTDYKVLLRELPKAFPKSGTLVNLDAASTAAEHRNTINSLLNSLRASGLIL